MNRIIQVKDKPTVFINGGVWLCAALVNPRLKFWNPARVVTGYGQSPRDAYQDFERAKALL